ncbi:MAG: malto-oligosyltrehalose synthase [Syntrophothermus sp.]
MIIPSATYRLQFNKEFKFSDAKKIISYLSSLGISTIYASPIFKAKSGSMHGYDVVNPGKLNPEVGTDEEFNELIKECKKYNLNWLQDIVPNHMSYSSENKMLIDLFENGPNSRFIDFFDIEWDHPHARVRQRVLAPFLGKFYNEALESGELKLSIDKEGFYIDYYENRFPIKMESYVDILSLRLNKLRKTLGKKHPDVIKYQGILFILKSFPSRDELDERYDQIQFAKGIIWELYTSNEEIKKSIEDALIVLNGEQGNPDSYNMLDDLLREQYYRLAFWKVANEEINYRRFFNINELISLKMENEEVFEYVHKFAFKLFKENKIMGLRIDHVDGLFDPTTYLVKLRNELKEAYIVVEKIVDLEEEFPPEWDMIQGTTGYEFTNYLNGLFTSRGREREIDSAYRKFINHSYDYEKLVFEKKRLIIKTLMAGEVERLAFLVENISSKDRRGVDFTMHGLMQALDEFLTYFPVYRTYINKDNLSQRDVDLWIKTLQTIKRIYPRYTKEYEYIAKLLTLDLAEHFADEQKQNALFFTMKTQQLTGPLMAKGFEDTTLYIYNRLLSLNEVGGNPGKFGISKIEFHNFNYKRLNKTPHSMNATSTHDTKRGEDVRARINVISEIGKEWYAKLKLWNNLNKEYKTLIGKEYFPDRNDEYFLYQTLLGSYESYNKDNENYIKRIKEYVIKAVREAKVHTAWIKPDEEYENAFINFVEKILEIKDDNKFLNDFIPFQNKISYYGAFNSLSQTIIKMTSPGVPDIYQGTELWDYSLVDPDNRRPVDYTRRNELLQEIKEQKFYDLSIFNDDIICGKTKLFIIHKMLELRKTYKDVFDSGKYIPLGTGGKHKFNIISFARELNDKIIVVIVPRFLTGLIKEGELPLGDFWDTTCIKTKIKRYNWTNILSGDKGESENELMVKDYLKNFPAAVLINK